MEKRLIDFYGEECPHCHNMDPLVERVEKEMGSKIKKTAIKRSFKYLK